MAQFNMHVTPDFERMLARYMRIRGIKTKSEALRCALEEALGLAARKAKPADFETWLGLAKRAPLNPKQRFASDRELWEP